MKIFTLISALLTVAYCGNDIDPDFMTWMENNLSSEEVTALVRNDLTTGSFGGGVYNGSVRPVIFVHGLNNEAGSLWQIRAGLVALGIPVQRTFATSWGNGASAFNLSVTIECAYVQQIRRFTEVVLQYTGASQVDIIGYSMGSPIARKSILGGNCVDNSTVDIGEPLTSKVHNYISVAGANQGSYLCTLPLFPICNLINGLGCGSQFLNDINSNKNYESTSHSFDLASTTDELVGYFACLTKASLFDGAQEYVVNFKSHTQTEYDTADIQYQMLTTA